MTKQDVYEEITDRIIASLESGTVPWRKPWTSTAGGPVNVRNGRQYRGINIFLLELQSMSCGYSDPRWGTYKAISEAGGQVRKGEKGTRIILWKPVSKKPDEQGENGREYLLLRTYTVFNAEQADGLPERPVVDADYVEPHELADRIIEGYANVPGPGVVYGGSSAAYSPAKDIVFMPPREDFHGTGEFYSTLFHELTHSTGHEKRLGRIEPAIFGSDPYAREELVAEMGAAMLNGLCGIETAEENSAAYIANWLRRLKDDRKLVIQAAAQAQKAADLIVGDTLSDAELTEELAATAA